ncbi:DNA-binding MarR family transcriptional regulator [Arthrobacter sp. CAN_A6]
MGKVLEKLELKGLVLRARDTWDGRAVRTRITSQGNTILRRMDQITEAPTGSVGPSDRELRDALITIITTLKATSA